MAGIQNLYDAETWMEDAFACALIDKGLAVVTPRGVFDKFQQARPRIQLEFFVVGAKQGYGPTGYTDRNASYSGMIKAAVIANATAGGNPVLRAYRAQLRNAMAELRPFTSKAGINGVRPAGEGDDPMTFGTGTAAHSIAVGDQYLAFHAVQNIVEAHNAPLPSPETGVEAHEIDFQIDFGVRADAWAELNTP